MIKELLQKYLNDNCSDQEFEEIVRWVQEEAQKKEGRRWVLEDWQSFTPDSEAYDEQKFSALLDKIHHKINLNSSSESKIVSINKVSVWLGRVAAVLFLPLLGILIYMFSNNNLQHNIFSGNVMDSLEIIAPVGSRTVVQLADGTEVNLNYGSRIKYPRVFTGKKREVELVGEGYFDVTTNPKKPFVVKTAKLNIKALGTEFNVKAYPNDDVIATTLIEGKVVIEKHIAEDKAEAIGALVPNQHVAFNTTTGKIESTKGKVDKYIGWKEGKLVFDNEPIEQVAQRLNRMFNVDIEIDEDVKDYSYTVTFVNDRLFLILDLMTKITPVSYKVYPRQKLGDGTFSKQRIRIEKRK